SDVCSSDLIGYHHSRYRICDAVWRISTHVRRQCGQPRYQVRVPCVLFLLGSEGKVDGAEKAGKGIAMDAAEILLDSEFAFLEKLFEMVDNIADRWIKVHV